MPPIKYVKLHFELTFFKFEKGVRNNFIGCKKHLFIKQLSMANKKDQFTIHNKWPKKIEFIRVRIYNQHVPHHIFSTKHIFTRFAFCFYPDFFLRVNDKLFQNFIFLWSGYFVSWPLAAYIKKLFDFVLIPRVRRRRPPVPDFIVNLGHLS